MNPWRALVWIAWSAVMPLLAQAQSPDPKLAVVRGRCVAAENGKPLAGCKVQFEGRPGNAEVMSLHGKPDWKDPEPIVTGADGRFEFRFAPPPPYQHHLDVSCAGRTPRTARWDAFEPGQVDDLGDVPLARGHVLRGKVLDQRGNPVPRVQVGVVDLPLPLRQDAANDTRYGVSKDDGTFQVEVPLPPGTWKLRVDSDGCSLVEPESVTVEAQAWPNLVTVRVQRMPSISGVVFDDRGHPVPGVCLQVKPGGGNWTTSTWSRKDGSFALWKRNGNPDEVRLEVGDPGPCEIAPIEGTFRWETHGLRIELPRALTFELTVVEAGTGRPVEAYAVHCHPVAKVGHSGFTRLRLGESPHPGGKVTVDKVWRGKNVMRVVPRDPALAPSEAVTFEANADAIGPVRLEVVRLHPIELQLVDGTGQPLRACAAWIVDDCSNGHWDLRQGMFSDVRGSRTVMSSDPKPLPLAMGHGTTDADGKVRLHYAPTRGSLTVVVRQGKAFLVAAGFDPAAVADGKVVVQ